MSEDSLLFDALEYLDCAILDYSEWTSVGMALHHEGYDCSIWDAWSAKDTARYKDGECERKWNSFGRSGCTPVTAGTVIEMAKERGFDPSAKYFENNYALDWDCEVYDNRIVDVSWIESQEVQEPTKWNKSNDLIRYLEAVFDNDDIVGYVTESWDNNGRFVPSGKGICDRTAGELVKSITKYKDDFSSSLGSINEEAGAWIRFNPLDGKGVRNDNVKEFKHALVESDNMPIDKQMAIIKELELPCSAIVHSGNKSVHAIVKIEADDYKEYRKRVDFLYSICQKNGLNIDTQNKNPSRLSRMPGVMRNGKKQWLISTDCGAQSWASWVEWLEEQNDEFPEPENLADCWEDMPELAPELIEGILRQGHKMLVSGPSKAGKSFALIELCIAIAEGKEWIGHTCAQGRVLYVNLELDRSSCLNRFKDVYNALKIVPDSLSDIDIWNLRGKSKPMTELAPALIRRAIKTKPIAVIIDPIYKVITGDENSADQMANFCNNFDKISESIGCSVIYCHHHSKGSQGQKRAMDRASGSGVFARDPDALMDLMELYVPTDMREKMEKAAVDKARTPEERFPLRQAAKNKTAWRIECTLREFPCNEPINAWFEYPIHKLDTDGELEEARSIDEAGEVKLAEARKDEWLEKIKEFEAAFVECEKSGNETPTIKELLDTGCITITDREITIKNWIKKMKNFELISYGRGGKPAIVRRKGLSQKELESSFESAEIK